jgi:hypothetical protein
VDISIQYLTASWKWAQAFALLSLLAAPVAAQLPTSTPTPSAPMTMPPGGGGTPEGRAYCVAVTDEIWATFDALGEVATQYGLTPPTVPSTKVPAWNIHDQDALAVQAPTARKPTPQDILDAVAGRLLHDPTAVTLVTVAELGGAVICPAGVVIPDAAPTRVSPPQQGPRPVPEPVTTSTPR